LIKWPNSINEGGVAVRDKWVTVKWGI